MPGAAVCLLRPRSNLAATSRQRRPPPSQVRCIPATWRAGHIGHRATRTSEFALDSPAPLSSREQSPRTYDVRPRPVFVASNCKARQQTLNYLEQATHTSRSSAYLTEPCIAMPNVALRAFRSLDSARKRKTRTKPFLRTLLTPPPQYNTPERVSQPNASAVAPFPPTQTQLCKTHQRNLRIPRTKTHLGNTDSARRLRPTSPSAESRESTQNHDERTKRMYQYVPRTAKRRPRESRTHRGSITEAFCKAVKARPRNHKHTTHIGHAESTRGRCGEFLRLYAAWNRENPAEIAGVSDSRGAERRKRTYRSDCRSAERRPRESWTERRSIRGEFCDVVKAELRNLKLNTYAGNAKSARGRCGDLVGLYAAWNRRSPIHIAGALHQSPLSNKPRTPTSL
ncbi:hypothetical protein C8R43DRAFT_1244573, partial [Mycena crocata]